MDAAQTRLCLQLHSAADIGEQSLTRLLLKAGSPLALAAGGPAMWREQGLSEQAVRSLGDAVDGRPARRAGSGELPALDIDRQEALLSDAAARILPVTDPDYPPLLRSIHDPPPLLYVRGKAELLAQAQVAVVGSRRASPAGLRAAGALAGDVSRAGLLVTSGLARGIDGAAHQGALAAQGSSIAVVATGIDRVYPTRHRALALALEQQGSVVTEFPPGMPPLAQNFPRRNRIISGLALGVLVIEAALPSGSLITARTAMEQGREVFALPWSIYHQGGAGCLHLLRDGAKMVESIADVLDELHALYTLQQELLPTAGAEGRGDAVPDSLSTCERQVLALVGYERVSVDELCQLSALPVARLMAALSALEMHGVVARSAGGYIRS